MSIKHTVLRGALIRRQKWKHLCGWSRAVPHLQMTSRTFKYLLGEFKNVFQMDGWAGSPFNEANLWVMMLAFEFWTRWRRFHPSLNYFLCVWADMTAPPLQCDYLWLPCLSFNLFYLLDELQRKSVFFWTNICLLLAVKTLHGLWWAEI